MSILPTDSKGDGAKGPKAKMRPQEHERAARPPGRASTLASTKPKPSTAAQEVELGGVHRRFIHVPREICPVRAEQKSGEVVVARTSAERRNERRTEERRKQLEKNLIPGPGTGDGDEGTPQSR